jgi:hypothetical protein
VNNLAWYALIAAVISLIATANMPWPRWPIIHTVAAGLFFMLYLIWAALAVSVRWSTDSDASSNSAVRIRIGAIGLGIFFYLAMVGLAIGSGQSHLFAPTKLSFDERSVLLHLAAACEWMLMLSFTVHTLALAEEVRGRWSPASLWS